MLGAHPRRRSTGRPSADVGRAVVGLAAVALTVLPGCSGGAGGSGGSADSAQTASTTGDSTATGTGPTLPTFTEGVGLSEWLPYRDLDVRVLDYDRAGIASDAGADTRVDVVAVEECAHAGADAVVSHRQWRLVDSAGRVLGAAGGKVVGGAPTEDLPLRLDAGSCATTSLTVAVPADADVTAVRDGTDTTWVLPSP